MAAFTFSASICRELEPEPAPEPEPEPVTESAQSQLSLPLGRCSSRFKFNVIGRDMCVRVCVRVCVCGSLSLSLCVVSLALIYALVQLVCCFLATATLATLFDLAMSRFASLSARLVVVCL